MSSQQRPIIDRLLAGEEYDLTKVDDEIRAWHEGDDSRQLHDRLGFSSAEYALFVERPESLRYILAARHEDVPVEKLLAAPRDTLLLAARGATREEVEGLRQWLRSTGRL
jgi:hypothetical protein